MQSWMRGIITAVILFVLIVLLQPREGALYVREGVYYVENFQALEELSTMLAQTEGEFEGEVRLTADIQAERPFVPIGNSQSTFNGTFDGCGYVIDGLSIQEEGLFQGMFAGMMSFYGLLAGGISVGGVTLSAVVSTALLILIAAIVFKIIRSL